MTVRSLSLLVTWASLYWSAWRVLMVMPTMEIATKLVDSTEIHLAAMLGAGVHKLSILPVQDWRQLISVWTMLECRVRHAFLYQLLYLSHSLIGIFYFQNKSNQSCEKCLIALGAGNGTKISTKHVIFSIFKKRNIF